MITISRLINRYKSNIAVMILPEHSDNDGEINPLFSVFTICLGQLEQCYPVISCRVMKRHI